MEKKMTRDSTDMQEPGFNAFEAARDDASVISEEQLAIALRAAGVSVEDVRRLLSGDIAS